MSEYQYYEFLALDRPLTKKEMDELRAVSSRGSITPTHFVNEYNWGNFKADPFHWMEKYFDAFLYVANWGSCELMLRLPSQGIDRATAERYCVGWSAKAQQSGDHTILAFHSAEEGEDYFEGGSGLLSALVPLRADLLGGDYRALYLAWLLCVQNEELDEEEPEPPVPPGLGKLTAPLQALVDFLSIDEELVEAAAERSAAATETPPEELERWVAALPEAEKTRLLVRLVRGEESHVRGELLRRFRQARPTTPSGAEEPRTVAELLDAAERRAEQRRREDEERAARERARREQAEAEARNRRLDALAKREAEAWREVDEMIASKKPTSYDAAVRLLGDLRQLGVRAGRAAEVEARLQALREQHARKPSFLARLDQANLTGSRS